MPPEQFEGFELIAQLELHTIGALLNSRNGGLLIYGEIRRVLDRGAVNGDAIAISRIYFAFFDRYEVCGIRKREAGEFLDDTILCDFCAFLTLCHALLNLSGNMRFFKVFCAYRRSRLLTIAGSYRRLCRIQIDKIFLDETLLLCR